MKKFVAFMLVVMMCTTLITPRISYAATIKISKSKLTVNVGKTYTLKITGTTRAIKWTSSNKTVATVSTKGKITAKKAGTATITATVNKKPYKCAVTVKDPYVKVVFRAMLTGDTTIEEYIETVKDDKNYGSVTKYDDDHYLVTMRESYRLLQIKAFNKMIEDLINKYLTDPVYSKIFTDVKYNSYFNEIKLYAAKDAFKSFKDFLALPYLANMSDNYQAFKLVDVKDRSFLLEVIDKDTNEILYSY
jgi:hypothetical protein